MDYNGNIALHHSIARSARPNISNFFSQFNSIRRFNDIIRQMRQGTMPTQLQMQLSNERHFGCSTNQNMYVIV